MHRERRFLLSHSRLQYLLAAFPSWESHIIYYESGWDECHVIAARRTGWLIFSGADATNMETLEDQEDEGKLMIRLRVFV
jgi:hypothetical protein